MLNVNILEQEGELENYYDSKKLEARQALVSEQNKY